MYKGYRDRTLNASNLIAHGRHETVGGFTLLSFGWA